MDGHHRIRLICAGFMLLDYRHHGWSPLEAPNSKCHIEVLINLSEPLNAGAIEEVLHRVVSPFHQKTKLKNCPGGKLLLWNSHEEDHSEITLHLTIRPDEEEPLLRSTFLPTDQCGISLQRVISPDPLMKCNCLLWVEELAQSFRVLCEKD